MCLEIFKVNRDSIKDDMLALFNQMYLDGRIMKKQKRRIVLRIPKLNFPTTPVDYKPISSVNTD